MTSKFGYIGSIEANVVSERVEAECRQIYQALEPRGNVKFPNKSTV